MVPVGHWIRRERMEAKNKHKLDELERLLNDPDAPLDAPRIWALLAEIETQGTIDKTVTLNSLE
jgi:hypothetical protein